MRKIYIHLVYATLFCVNAFTQEFQFNIYFEDARGNRDTVTLGYDAMATDTIDPEFGEVNIINTPWDSVFEVRITDEYIKRIRYEKSATFHSKKQVLLNPCEKEIFKVSVGSMDIFCKHWPIEVSWDMFPTDNDCLQNSIITDKDPRGWFDFGDGSFVECLISNSSIFINNNHWKFESSGYINNSGDTLRYLFFALGDVNKISIYGPSCKQVALASIEKSPIILFPNPGKGIYKLNHDNVEIRINKISILNTLGQIVTTLEKQEFIDISNLPDGVYYYQLIIEEGGFISGKLIKQ